RFDARRVGWEKVGMAELLTSLLDFSSASAIGFVVLAETACIVGTSLLKSPALGPLDYAVPGVRDWLSFTTERVSEKSLAILVGVAGRDVSPETAAVLPPPPLGSTIPAPLPAPVFFFPPLPRRGLPVARPTSPIIAPPPPQP